MTDILSSPPNTTTRAAADQAVILAPAATAPIPANPAAILAQQAAPKPNNRTWLLWVGGAAIAAQALLPPELTPFGLIYNPIQKLTMGNQLELMRQGAINEKIAELEARRADALGDCWITFAAAPLCREMVNEKFNTSVAQARRAAGR